MNAVVGLIAPPPFPIWVTLHQTAQNTDGLTFGHGIVLGLALCATWGLCASAIWIKRAIVRRSRKANIRGQPRLARKETNEEIK